MRFDEINDATGFAEGELFSREEQVRSYFTEENMKAMFGTVTIGQDDLDEMAEAVIDNRWHMDHGGE